MCVFCVSFPFAGSCMFSCFPRNWWSVSFSSTNEVYFFELACLKMSLFFLHTWLEVFWEIILRLLKKYYSFVLWLLMLLLRCVLIYSPLCGFFLPLKAFRTVSIFVFLQVRIRRPGFGLFPPLSWTLGVPFIWKIHIFCSGTFYLFFSSSPLILFPWYPYLDLLSQSTVFFLTYFLSLFFCVLLFGDFKSLF